MEVYYCFYLGPVAVAGIITNSRKINGEIIAPVNKFIEIKPGVLLSFNGPHEDNMEYMDYFMKRYDRYPDMNGEQAAQDFKEHIGKEEVDAQSFMVLMTNAMKNGHKWSAEKQAKVMEELQAHPMNKLMTENPRSIEDSWIANKSISQFNLIEVLPKSYNHYRGTISDIFVMHIDKYQAGDVSHFHFGSIPIDDSQSAAAGQNALDLMKKMKQYLPQVKKNNNYGATILKNVIFEYHYKNIKNAHPLQFLQVGPHTDYRWIPLED